MTRRHELEEHVTTAEVAYRLGDVHLAVGHLRAVDFELGISALLGSIDPGELSQISERLFVVWSGILKDLSGDDNDPMDLVTQGGH